MFREKRLTSGPLAPRAISKYSLLFSGLTSSREEASAEMSRVADSMILLSSSLTSE